MLTIGEFSRVTRLSIKALRLYHAKGLLVPSSVDLRSRYRHYSRRDVERAMVIRRLQELGFSLREIKEIVTGCQDDVEIAEHVCAKLAEIRQTIKDYEGIRGNLRSFLDSVAETPASSRIHVAIEEIPESRIAGIRFRGRYDEVGTKFAALFRAAGRWAAGRPFSLYYDGEFKEEGADIEACVEVKKEIKAPDLSCRRLPGGKAATLLHYGPYEELGRSYQRLFEYCREHNLATQLPIRERYLKGPGLILKGNPRMFVTELMALISG